MTHAALSFSDKEALKKSAVFVLVHGADKAGDPMYFYLAVAAGKWDAFKLALKQPSLDAEKFGKVLYCAYGDGPSELVTRTVEEHYGISLRGCDALKLDTDA